MTKEKLEKMFEENLINLDEYFEKMSELEDTI